MGTDTMHWGRWLKHGDQYLKAAIPKGNKLPLGAEIQYNLLSMSLESYIMAMLDYNNCLPENHTYTDLLTALENTIGIEEKLKNRILKYENIQTICSLEKYHRSVPGEEELTDLKGAIMELGEMAHGICNNN